MTFLVSIDGNASACRIHTSFDKRLLRDHNPRKPDIFCCGGNLDGFPLVALGLSLNGDRALGSIGDSISHQIHS